MTIGIAFRYKVFEKARESPIHVLLFCIRGCGENIFFQSKREIGANLLLHDKSFIFDYHPHIAVPREVDRDIFAGEEIEQPR